MTDPCLSCQLDDCDETHPDCSMREELTSPMRKYYLKVKDTPEYKKMKREIKRKWLQTSRGKKLWAAQVARYKKAHPEVIKAASKKYYEKNKERLLAEAREYKKKIREKRNEAAG